MSYDETVVKDATINMQNNNNIDILNCKANLGRVKILKQQYFTLHVKKIQGLGSFIIY